MGIDRKYDFDKWKLEFMTSEFDSHIIRLREIKGIDGTNGHVAKNVKGRSEEKKIIKDSIYNLALKKAKKEAVDDIVKSLKFDMRKLMLLKTKTLGLVQNKLQGIDERRIERDDDGKPMKDENGNIMVNNDRIDVGELKQVLIMLKMELGEFEGMARPDEEESKLTDEEADSFEKFKTLVSKKNGNGLGLAELTDKSVQFKESKG